MVQHVSTFIQPEWSSAPPLLHHHLTRKGSFRSDASGAENQWQAGVKYQKLDFILTPAVSVKSIQQGLQVAHRWSSLK